MAVPAFAALPKIEVRGDPDNDSDKYPGEWPDTELEPFGHPASAADARAVGMAVARYYAAARRGDGTAACGLLYADRAEALAFEGGAGGHGGSCAVTLSRLFRQMRARLNAPAPRVQAARVYFEHASAQLRFAGKPRLRYIALQRERGEWKLDMLLDVDRPVGAE